MTEDLAARLNKAAGSGASITGYEGQVVTFASITKTAGKFPGQDVSVKATILDAEGNEEVVYVTPTIGRQLIEVEDVLPIDAKVVSYPSNFGKPGYKLELA